MRFAFIIINISSCLILTVFGRLGDFNLDQIKANHHPDPNNNVEDALDEITRKKKSTVTTLCVEIRPIDEKPYQVCEPVTEKGSYSNPAPYFPQNGGFEHVKPETSYNSGSSTQSKPTTTYSTTPIKTYQSSGSSTASKPAYGAYRSTKPEREEEPEKSIPARVSKPEINEKSTHPQDKKDPTTRKNQDTDDDSMRTAHHHETYNYGSGYGSPTSMIPVTPANHGHSGLVITCQPNLAGYAHSVPGAFQQGAQHGGGVAAYNYRTANPNYGRPYQPYKSQPQSYGNYKPVYRPQAQIYEGPVYQNPYFHPTAASPLHVYRPSEFHETSIPAPRPNSNHFSAYQPPVQPSPLSVSVLQPQPTPSSPAAPSIYQPPAAYYPPSSETPVSEYKPVYTAPTDYKPPVYAPAYVPPGYRSAEEENVENKADSVERKMDKEAYTLETMSKMGKNFENSRWKGEIKPTSAGEARNAELDMLREAMDVVFDPQVERTADDTLGVPQGSWREAEMSKTASNWRSEEEGTEMRNKANRGHDVKNWESLPTDNFRNADNSQGIIENGVSSENKIEDSL